MQTKIFERYFFFSILLATIVFCFFLFKPFLTVIILGACFSVILTPFYTKLKHKLPESLASIICVFVFIIALCIPIFGTGTIVYKQTQNLYSTISNTNSDVFIQKIENKINNSLPNSFQINAKEKISELVNILSSNITKIFSTTISTIFSFLLLIVTIFYFLKDGKRWREMIISLSPLNDTNDEKIVDRLSNAISGVMKGYLLIAFIQAMVMGAGLYIFGVPHFAIWALASAFASLIPAIGTALISVPAILFLFFTGNIGGAIGLTIWAGFAVGLIDNLLTPVFLSKKVNIPPLFILFSVLGGVSLFGPIGILIGPIIISFFHVLISIYRNTKWL